ncbi:hypothetical protein [Pseudomonas rhodesiae]|uniref:hypothetical protein n=1 Tax=Pseudomonas rhodesiae TaxID=76760 RepID=UPI0032B15D34
MEILQLPRNSHLADGTASAHISGVFTRAFKADTVRLDKTDAQWVITARQSAEGSQPSFLLTCLLPLSLRDNGKPHTYSFDGTRKVTTASAAIFTANTTFAAVSGEITVTLRKNRIVATFNFTAQPYNQPEAQLMVSRGSCDVHNGTGKFEVELSGEMLPTRSFKAENLAINTFEHLGIDPYYNNQGWTHVFPYTEYFFAVQIDTKVREGTYKIVLDDPRIGILTNLIGLQHLYATSGQLTIKKMPHAGHALADFKVEFNHPPFPVCSAKGQLNIQDYGQAPG